MSEALNWQVFHGRSLRFSQAIRQLPFDNDHLTKGNTNDKIHQPTSTPTQALAQFSDNIQQEPRQGFYAEIANSMSPLEEKLFVHVAISLGTARPSFLDSLPNDSGNLLDRLCNEAARVKGGVACDADPLYDALCYTVAISGRSALRCAVAKHYQQYKVTAARTLSLKPRDLALLHVASNLDADDVAALMPVLEQLPEIPSARLSGLRDGLDLIELLRTTSYLSSKREPPDDPVPNPLLDQLRQVISAEVPSKAKRLTHALYVFTHADELAGVDSSNLPVFLHQKPELCPRRVSSSGSGSVGQSSTSIVAISEVPTLASSQVAARVETIASPADAQSNAQAPLFPPQPPPSVQLSLTIAVSPPADTVVSSPTPPPPPASGIRIDDPFSASRTLPPAPPSPSPPLTSQLSSLPAPAPAPAPAPETAATLSDTDLSASALPQQPMNSSVAVAAGGRTDLPPLRMLPSNPRSDWLSSSTTRWRPVHFADEPDMARRTSTNGANANLPAEQTGASYAARISRNTRTGPPLPPSPAAHSYFAMPSLSGLPPVASPTTLDDPSPLSMANRKKPDKRPSPDVHKLVEMVVVEEDEPTHDRYPRQHEGPRDGRMYIFNFRYKRRHHHNHHAAESPALEPRPSSTHDARRLASLSHSLHFHRRYYEDRTRDRFDQTLERALQRPFPLVGGVFCLVLMGHGDQGGILCVDGNLVTITELRQRLSTAPTLIGVPKLVIVVACRHNRCNQPQAQAQLSAIIQTRATCSEDLLYEDEEPDDQLELYQKNLPELRPTFQSTTCQSNLAVCMPKFARGVRIDLPADGTDFLWAMSTVEGYVSFLNPEDGAPFIHQLCDVFNTYAAHEDAVRMLERVNDYFKRAAFDKAFDNERQLCVQPEFRCTLSAPLYLAPAAPRLN